MPVASILVEERPMALPPAFCTLHFAMARWPRHVWTTIFTYGAIFVLFPLLSLLAYGWVRGWWF
jgi:hypothetical protein